ncbi:sigma-54-dependent transcriptional regulator [Desulfovibrio legallii]|uniref:Two-component system, NtrC family, response regulator HydG n=1 Tax=Desulfovibrio legallii TaxID=571438 RepID=A0A1G7I2M5_9BACT|nr:sigma-54 dependent transcriptional regulator [Desulfovibrio legallii]SDF07037.1 two-component system, NtrC family, response regulator HydG [Desulfovibrio legallii]
MNAQKSIQLLVVDDDRNHREMLEALLEEWGYAPTGLDNGEAAVALCRERPFDLILMDVRMGGMNGVEATRAIKAYNPAIPILIMTAYSDVAGAVEALKAGAYDYLTKPLAFDVLKLALKRALDHATLKDEVRSLRHELAAAFDARQIIGQSPAMRQVLDLAAAIAPSEATVLITGESGTGKEVMARLIHANSARRNGPYVTVNCAALTETLLESELFGHEKGAFTGAEKRREGRFMAAHKGTIFLDEIGEIPLSMQVKLLRVIQEREIQRVGGDQPLKVDVRILAATNKDLAQEVAEGRFRQDLYYRLNVVALTLPPLRDRREDIPLLAMHFLKIFAQRNGKGVKGFTPTAMDRLLKHSWPGNVRELENAVERAVVLLVGEYVSERELPPTIVAGEEAPRPASRPDFAHMTLEEIERLAVQDTLEQVGGNKSEAARRLGINRKTLLAKLGK